MAGNRALHKAMKAKQDEFYTELSDIENEMQYYRSFFKDKIVFCNCDDPYESNFFKFFAMQFNILGLKKLMATSYDGSPIAQQEISFEEFKDGQQKKPYYAEITELEDYNGDGAKNLLDIEWALKYKDNTVRKLKGNGDFRSEECIELLKQADIVVTNPPHSLLREYIAQLVQYDKKFIILGNINAVTYKEFFPLIMQNKMWLGVSIHSGDRKFYVPDNYPLEAAGCGIDENGRRFIRVKGVRWLTNLEHKKRNEKITLYRRYYEAPSKYPKYDNYDAIEVSKVSEIPCDYDGVMGVPITFLDKYNPEQFEIIGMAKRGAGDPALRTKVYTMEDSPKYSDLNAGPVLKNEKGQLHNTYPRILIRRK